MVSSNNRLSARVIACLAVTGMLVGACGKKDKKSDDDDDSTGSGVVSTGGGANQSSLVAAASGNIATVEAKMVPKSLDLSTASLSLADGPCAGTGGFFDCQPNLLKLYLSMGKQMITLTQAMVASAGTGLSHVPIPSSGSVEPAGGNIAKIDYKVTSTTDYAMLVHSSTGPFLDLVVKDNTYTIKVDTSKAQSDGDDSSHIASVETVIKYTDDANFTVDLKLAGMGCNSDDIRAPQSIGINLAVVGGVWQGKAMLYLPRWLVADGTTCSFTPTDASKMFFYTDFVGDDKATTMSLYFLPSTVASADAFGTYPVSATCSNFASACSNGHGFGDPNPVSSYANAACVTPDHATTWGAACASSNALISTPTYSSKDLWVLPKDLAAYTLTVPASLD